MIECSHASTVISFEASHVLYSIIETYITFYVSLFTRVEPYLRAAMLDRLQIATALFRAGGQRSRASAAEMEAQKD